MLIGVFFISSMQLLFLGVMGEYVGAIYTQVQKRPYAVELDRINFEYPPSYPKSSALLDPLIASNGANEFYWSSTSKPSLRNNSANLFLLSPL